MERNSESAAVDTKSKGLIEAKNALAINDFELNKSAKKQSLQYHLFVTSLLHLLERVPLSLITCSSIFQPSKITNMAIPLSSDQQG